MAALWGRLGRNSEDPRRTAVQNISRDQFIAVSHLWVIGAAKGGLTQAEAVNELALTAAEKVQAARWKTALEALPSDIERMLAVIFLSHLLTLHEIGGKYSVGGTSKYSTGVDVEQALIDYFNSFVPPISF